MADHAFLSVSELSRSRMDPAKFQNLLYDLVKFGPFPFI